MEKNTNAQSQRGSFFGRLKNPSRFSNAQLLVFVLAFGIIGYFIYTSLATSPLVASLQAEQMSTPRGTRIVTDSTASGGKALELYDTSTTTGSVSFPSSVTSMTIVAKETYCGGYPWMKVAIDGKKVYAGYVKSTSWAAYDVSFPANYSLASYPAGNHNLAISFTNDTFRRGQCDKNLFVDLTNFYGPSSVTPAPTVALSASPPSVSAGQSATLTWTSTNATSCSASGAWSGSQPTSGSVSTGALNQNSTYTLTCAGAGGSAADSASVSVTNGFTTSLKDGMSVTTPYTWTFDPGVPTTAGYFWDGGTLITKINGPGPYKYVIQSGALSDGVHNLGHGWDLASDGSHHTPPSTYAVTINNSSSGGSTPSASLSASPASINSGSSSSLSWTSANATACSASGAWSGSKGTSGSQSVSPASNSTYTLTCSGSGGSASDSATVAVTTTTPPPSAPAVYLSPSSATYSSGSTITVQVRENSGSTAVNTVQANFSYPANLLTFVSIDGSASPFTVAAQGSGGNGQVSIARGVIGKETGDQLVATVTFKVSSSGSAKLAFTSGTALYTSSGNTNLITSLSLTDGATYTIN